MPVWIVVVPLVSLLALAAAFGLFLDLSRGRQQRAMLLDANEMRARAALDYYNHTHDSMTG